MTSEHDPALAPSSPRGRRRRRVPVIAGGIVAALVAIALLLTSIFQFGLPWWSGEADRNHVHVASDGTRIHYQVHLPPAYDEGEALPVMMALHGCAMTGFGWNSMKSATHFNELADREGFIVVYPTQRPFASPINCWNSADPRNQIRGAGEPLQLAGVAQEVVDTYDADPQRVHVSGASSGAGAAVILGATYPDVFATVTSVAGGEYALNQVDPDDPGETPPTTTARQAWAQMGERSRQVPILIVQGGDDEVVPTLVGDRLVAQWSAIDDLADDGLLNDSLELTARERTYPAQDGRHAWSDTSYTDADGTTLIEYVFVPDMGHAWSGPDGEGIYTDPSGPDVAELAWRLAEGAVSPAR